MLSCGIIIVLSAFMVNYLWKETDSIEKSGFESPQKSKLEEEGSDSRTHVAPVNTVQLVFSNPNSWLLAIAAFSLYIVRTTILDWVVLILIEEKGQDTVAASSCIFWFEISGFIGGFVSSVLSDRVWLGNRIPILMYFSVGCVLTSVAFWMSSSTSYLANVGLLSLLGFFVYCPQTLIGVAATEIVDKTATGTILGLVGAFSGTGAVFAGVPVGWIREFYGWNSVYICIISFSTVMTVMFIIVHSSVFQQQKRRGD
eukprot:TRINITY_DN2199_c0_g1_i2.p1 TRINITY_DN2199_c0_g1~~TRINITY_DN2199_c0_g1_i2.p1  ORF type:complete len:256 (-),score=38.18 TRINITY_DN2199_c0_g1_i2:41-808(-)